MIYRPKIAIGILATLCSLNALASGDCSLKNAVIDKCGQMIPNRMTGDDPQPIPEKRDTYSIFFQSLTTKPGWQPIVRIAERSPSTDPIIKSYTGHILILVGQRAPDGTTMFEAGYGLYPKSDSTIVELISIAHPIDGVLKYSWSDLIPDHVLDVDVTGQQYSMVENIIENWKVSTKYGLLSANCVKFVTDVADYLGLTHNSELTPHGLAEALISKNDSKSALRHAEKNLEDAKAVMARMKAETDAAFHGIPTRHVPEPPPNFDPTNSLGVDDGNPGYGPSDRMGSGGQSGGPSGGSSDPTTWILCLPDRSMCS